MFTTGACSRFGVCLPSPHAIMALFCVVCPAWRSSWGVLGWIWLGGSTVSLAGGRESRGSATPWNAEPALVKAPAMHQHHDHGKAHTGTPSTQNHPNSPSSTHQAMPDAPIPWHRHPSLPCHHPGCATFLQILWLPTGISCRAMPCCAGCGARRQRLLCVSPGTGSNFPALKKLVKV